MFENVNAESWDEENTLDSANGVAFDSEIEAHHYAEDMEYQDPTEYGIVKNELWKDGAKVKIK